MCAVTCRATFGKVMKGRDTLTAMLKRIPIGGFDLSLLMRMRRRVDAILDHVIVEEHVHKRSGEYDGEDILDVLLRMQKNKELQFPISSDNIKAVILVSHFIILFCFVLFDRANYILQDMFTGGTETSTTTTDWAMAELMRNPYVMAKLQTEIREVLKGKTNVEENT